jgi:hypothetical protein
VHGTPSLGARKTTARKRKTSEQEDSTEFESDAVCEGPLLCSISGARAERARMAAHEKGAYEQQEEGNRDQGTENGERETGNGKRSKGTGRQGTENGRESATYQLGYTMKFLSHSDSIHLMN